MKIRISENRLLGEDEKPYIIAELGANHNGDMSLAKKMIYAAKKAGADCVKFQSWSKDSVFSKKVYQDNYFLTDDYRCRTDVTLEEIVSKYSISENQLLAMKTYANEIGVDCTSTPFSRREVDFLVNKMKVNFIKVASMDLNNYPFLSYIASKNKPVVLATGLSNLAEIDKAISTIENSGNHKIVILHCVSIYPPEDRQVNLRNLDTLSQAYPYPIGFSDHTLGTCIPLAAVAKGASLIEKHFTLDKTMPGWDHHVSADFKELQIIVNGAHRVQAALGSSRIARIEDSERLNSFRRSIVSAMKIQQGEIIHEEMLDFKRPGSGLPPEAMDYIIGKKAKRTIDFDELINFDDF